ncbi:1-deoxy-D-xylulose-5-phosphate reductoisomerase [Paenibacillus sp. IB182496]|uniref:1-deoxy-D-xylulose 5-phosphate reductoisomerase n=1 Tax=Paenibacillus sabuli TaxID=2772509 RepID=A0A927GRG3_9BACL|nr:1-deoxy-D-xylulose-5-phosphate reductoisomerase [Paenibacillus sabuli]MBD2845251.1 1-deoxy-D-xylulose-5-phosphate reductoisomerase [Paenibacillus sabuli]
MKKIAVLGSTGSIGTQTLDVIEHAPEHYAVTALAAGGNVGLLVEQAMRHRPRLVCLGTREAAQEAARLLPGHIRVVHGEEGLIEAAAATEADLVVTALVGSIGLRSTLAAIDAGKTIGLANKETLVTAGHLVMARAKARNCTILPIDSEHSAIFQCLAGAPAHEVNKLVLTASGGSFRDRSREQLRDVTVKEALQHPNWAMGAKITIDSATMVNKGLEVIEAHWLFDMPYDRIEVLIHPQSIIHSMVEFVDYSCVAQLGNPDMRVPIGYALAYPGRRPTPTSPLRLAELGTLDFREMDYERYRCLALAFACGRQGGTATTVFNAANEVAVARFLAGELAFLDIERVLETVLERHVPVATPDLATIEEADAWARNAAGGL